MSPVFITSIIGLAIAVLTLGHVAPSIQAAVYAKSTQSNLSREEALAQQIIAFLDKEGAAPSTVQDLVAKNYWRSVDNDNGYGAGYSFAIDATKGILTIETTISNAAARSAYLSSAIHTYKPTEKAGGVVSTTFVIPSRGSIGSQIKVPGRIPASSTAPDPAKNVYWYDTSGPTAVMRVSNGSLWLAAAVSGGGGAGPSGMGIDSSKIVSSPTDLPSVAADGDIRYIFNAASNTLDTLTYFNGGWRQTITGAPYAPGSNPLIVALSAQQLPRTNVGSTFSYDFKPAISAVYSSNLAPVTVDASKIYWTAPNGLPDGLSINAATGVVSGTPTTKSSRPPDLGVSFDIVATYGGSSGQNKFNLSIAPGFWQASSVTTGNAHACALTTGGSLKCWGRNLKGQLGNGASGVSADQSFPTSVTVIQGGVAAVALGQESTCALTTAGGVKCWGSNGYGELGNGTFTNSVTAVDVTGLTSGVSGISGFGYFYCAVTTTGGVYCWGYGYYGELGNNSTAPSNVPVPVSGLATGVKSVSSNSMSSCAVLTNGTVRCWGQGGYGNLGNGSTANSGIPVQVSGITNASSVSVGNVHACATLSDGTLRCWGDNGNGQLGLGSAGGTYATPTVVNGQTGIKTVTSLSMGACVLTNAGAVRCWGQNQYSAAGTGNTAGPVVSPSQVIGLGSGVSFISGGSGNTACGQTTTYGLMCWGYNATGQVGDGTTTDKSTPVSIYENW